MPLIEWNRDLYPGKGPLAGIYTGLLAANNPCSIIVACDMPFLDPSLLGYMIEFAPDFDVVAPKIGDKREPLHAVYSKNCLAPIKSLLEQERLKVTDFFPLVKVRYVVEEEINRFDPNHLSFLNINTEADLEKAKALIKKKD